MASNDVKEYINTSNQKENDEHAEISYEASKIYNLNEREFKIAIIKNSTSYKKIQIDSSMKSGTKLMKRDNYS